MVEAINPFESNPGWDIIKKLYSYFGLKDYVAFAFEDLANPENILELEAYDRDGISGDQYFWNKVMSDELKPNKYIRLKNFQISPWFPRKPGVFWTAKASQARQRALERHVENVDKGDFVLDLYGKALMTELGGIGSVNFRKDRDFVLITATASGNTEEGIPIICRKNIWESIEAEFQKEKMLEIDLQGRLVNINQDHDSFYLRAPSIPRVGILIDSLLNINIKTSMLDITATPWTIFKTKNKRQPYGFTYVHHSVINTDIEDTKKWIIDYVQNHKGKTILTDFDESLHHLNAVFPLNDVVNGSILDEKILGYAQRIHNDFNPK